MQMIIYSAALYFAFVFRMQYLHEEDDKDLKTQIFIDTRFFGFCIAGIEHDFCFVAIVIDTLLQL